LIPPCIALFYAISRLSSRAFNGSAGFISLHQLPVGISTDRNPFFRLTGSLFRLPVASLYQFPLISCLMKPT
jgi:hypothetical protein